MMPAQDILPFEEGFASGTREMPTFIEEVLIDDSTPWLTLLPNAVLLAIFGVLLFFAIGDIIRLLPYLGDCIIRARGNISLEHSVHTARERNFTAGVLALGFCLLADRYALYAPQYSFKLGEDMTVLFTVGTLAAFLLLRRILTGVLHFRNLDKESVLAARRGLYNYFIISAPIIGLTVLAFSVCGATDEAARTAIYVEMIVTYIFSTSRTAQILSSLVSGLATILYLCALDFIPVSALIAASMVF